MSSTDEPDKKEPETPRPEGTTTECHETGKQPPLTEVEVLHTFVNEYKARDEQSYRLQRWNLRLACVTAFLVLFYATVAALQWCETRGANQIATTANEDNRKATADARQGTEKNIKAAEESASAAVASVRAWIIEYEWRVDQVQGTHASFSIDFINAGKTPAYNIRATWEIVFAPPTASGVLPEFKGCPSEHERNPGVMAADQRFRIHPEDQFTEEQIAALSGEAGTSYLLIHGCVKYRDVLTPQERVTEFGFVFSGPSTSRTLAIDPRYEHVQ